MDGHTLASMFACRYSTVTQLYKSQLNLFFLPQKSQLLLNWQHFRSFQYATVQLFSRLSNYGKHQYLMLNCFFLYYVHMCVCVCMCVRERESERGWVFLHMIAPLKSRLKFLFFFSTKLWPNWFVSGVPSDRKFDFAATQNFVYLSQLSSLIYKQKTYEARDSIISNKCKLNFSF